MVSFKKVAWDEKIHPVLFKTILGDNSKFITNVKHKLETNAFEMWSGSDEFFFTIEVDYVMSGEKVLRVLDMCGKFMQHFNELSVFVDALGKTYGCDKVLLETHRKGLVRKYGQHGFKVVNYTLERCI